MQLIEFPATFVNFQCGQETFLQLPFSVRPIVFRQLPSTFRPARRPSVNIPCSLENFNFCQIFVRPEDLPSTFVRPGDFMQASVNFNCSLDIFRPIPSTFRVPGWTCVKFHQLSFGRVTIRQLTSTFSAIERHSVNFRECSEQPGDPPSTSVNFWCEWETFCKLLLTFCAACRPSINFHQLSIWSGDLPSTSAYFPCVRETFCESTFRNQNTYHQVLMHLLPSNSVIFPHGQETIRKLSLNFSATGRPSVNFRQIFMWLGDLPSTSTNIPCGRETYCELPSTSSVAERPSVNFCPHFVHPRDFP